MGVSKEGLSAVDDLVSSLEESMQSAADITNVLSSGSVAGVVNSMAAYGVAVDEDELMRELDDMMGEEEKEEKEKQEPQAATHLQAEKTKEDIKKEPPSITMAPAVPSAAEKTRKQKAGKNRAYSSGAPEKETDDESAVEAPAAF